MIRIFKYPLALAGETVIEANVVRWLGVHFQGAQLCVWAEVSASSTPMRVRLWSAMTGDEAPVDGRPFDSGRAQYIGTAHLDRISFDPAIAAPFVAHVYQLHKP